jgi:enamine deaminase RidA (YjgF/YER057c/UK114 family)
MIGVKEVVMQKKKVDGGVVYGNLFFMSGMCNIADTLEEEIRMNMAELKESLEKVGSGFEHVLSATVYLKDLNDRERVLNDLWAEYFPEPENKPARTCIEAGIGKCRCEITLVAAIPE